MEISSLLCCYFIGILVCVHLPSVLGDNFKLKETQVDQYIDQGCEGQRYDDFDFNLLNTVGTPAHGNVLLSPFSLKMVLAMLYEGASGATEKQLKQLLNFPINKLETNKRFQKILHSLRTANEGQTLDLGSRIFLDGSMKAQPRFQAVLKAFYDTDVKYVNFQDSVTSAQEINYWAGNVTHGKVQNLVASENLEQARLVLTNALYYKGLWRKPFPRENSTTGIFYTSDNSSVEVPLMRLDAHMYYGSSVDLDAQILRLPFQGGNIAMFILLPNSRTGLSRLIRSLSTEALRREICSMDDQLTVHLSLPRFAFQYNTKLREMLETLGLKHIFADTANLDGIARLKNTAANLMVSNILQKSGIEVNEEGSTVYVATAAPLSDRISGATDVNFTVSHPFLFYIEDEFTGNVLFAGKVENPGLQGGQPSPIQPLNVPDITSKEMFPFLPTVKGKQIW